MKDLRKEIDATRVPPGSVALWWLAQAGFAFKTHSGTRLFLDPYLSDAVEKAFGFKRLSLAPIDAEDVRADWFVNSHEHLDHLDTGALGTIAEQNPGCRFAGPACCGAGYDQCGIPAWRRTTLEAGGAFALDDVTVHAARADHGELSPGALALLFDFGATRILFTGDTALRPDWMRTLIERKPDVLLPCINGAFGNMDARQAAELTRVVSPRLAVPCHFWMFKEHGGDPEAFFKACVEICPAVPVRLLTPGDGLIVTSNDIHPVTARRAT